MSAVISDQQRISLVEIHGQEKVDRAIEIVREISWIMALEHQELDRQRQEKLLLTALQESE